MSSERRGVSSIVDSLSKAADDTKRRTDDMAHELDSVRGELHVLNVGMREMRSAFLKEHAMAMREADRTRGYVDDQVVRLGQYLLFAFLANVFLTLFFYLIGEML